MSAEPSQHPRGSSSDWILFPWLHFREHAFWRGRMLPLRSQGYAVRHGTFRGRSIDWKPSDGYDPPMWRRSQAECGSTSAWFAMVFMRSSRCPRQLIDAVPGAIVARQPGDIEIPADPHHHAWDPATAHHRHTQGTVFWGEYFDNAERDEVHVYASADAARTGNRVHIPKRRDPPYPQHRL